MGIIDTATIEFNRCFLIDKKNVRAITGLQYIISYLNGSDTPLNIDYLHKVINHLNSLFTAEEEARAYVEYLIYHIDTLYIQNLQQIHKRNKKYDKLPLFHNQLQEPYNLDSNKYILVKIKHDDSEGYFKMGLQDGLWKTYRKNSTLVKFDYEMHYGKMRGKTHLYDKNRIVIKETSYLNDGIEECKYFDEKGELVRIAYWKNNYNLRKDDKVYKQVPVEGDIVREKDKNGKIKEYIIKDREKVPLE
ncbi:hypothetical protein AD998_13425 [bacterium 336/3]|nr:hypothetical protein AD998_13425 [bacterium 336/3]